MHGSLLFFQLHWVFFKGFQTSAYGFFGLPCRFLCCCLPGHLEWIGISLSSCILLLLHLEDLTWHNIICPKTIFFIRMLLWRFTLVIDTQRMQYRTTEKKYIKISLLLIFHTWEITLDSLTTSVLCQIDIMKRLRHPNVLLFMGAVCSQEKLAIVTEFLPR